MVGSPSWQLTEAEADRAHVLLYIRDVAALEVPAEVDAPPRLAGVSLHGSSPVLDDDRRRRAGRDWADWWHALLEVEGRVQTGTDEDDSSFWSWAEDLGRVWDAPESWSLADLRALREATLALYPEVRRWVDAGPGSPARLRGEGHFAWTTVRDTAEGVAAARGVSPEEVRGRVMVLDVEGVWWRRVAPGTVLCSTAATETCLRRGRSCWTPSSPASPDSSVGPLGWRPAAGPSSVGTSAPSPTADEFSR